MRGVRSAVVLALAAVTAGAVVTAPVAAAPRQSEPEAGCTGGIAANPSLEKLSGGIPAGYTFLPAAPVPPTTPAGKTPRLLTDSRYAADGSVYALIQTPDGLVSSAEQDQRAVPGGAYTLTDWTGTFAPNLASSANAQYTGLRFYNAGGKQLLENKLDVVHDVAGSRVARQEFVPSVAPADTARVTFFASTNYNWVLWDCVVLQLAAYTVTKEVKDPVTGAWGKDATFQAGDTAHYRITVTNTGSQPLAGVKVRDPFCAPPPSDGPFTLDPGANRQLTCDHPNLVLADGNYDAPATVSGVTYPGGRLSGQTASVAVRVLPPPAIDKIGDFVWADTDRDGLQGQGEPGIAGVKVILKDGSGKDVATTTSGADGKYLVDKLADGTYQVCFDPKTFPAGLTPSPSGAGDDTKDSDVDPATGCSPQVTLGPGSRENLTVDLGLRPPPYSVGDFVWADTDRDGLQGQGEPGVAGVKVTLLDGAGKLLATVTTGADGAYLFTELHAAGYEFCFDAAGRQLTRRDAGDDTKDSDADPATGCTGIVQLDQDNRTLDAGLLTAP
ncbi:DUF7850 domain-containing protein [Amycolatopsis sp. H20-H5]|uniref:DUF7850 domain-containing protein n=1 Tax=Amycolatopsis sp. H20-H5 TaxID=3046309 RepID=UPI002DB88F8C|nr:SdrD B-like domain-containing protein [Amycolatopsis sp. H20-H5]MEC3981537.1 SdrD B-like domain-containing protein [Amycolatopsis sp. H20-H5]